MAHAHVENSVGELPQESPRSFAQRVVGAVRLQAGPWNEIVADAGAFRQAALVVLGAALAGAFAARANASTTAALQSAVSTLSTWPLFSLFLWALANWFGHPLRIATAFAVVGFAMAPLALLALAAAPLAPLQMVVRLLALALFFAALVGGTRQALRVDSMRAAYLCLLVGLLTIFLSMLLLFLVASGD
jgi:hypothetical protein